MGAKQHNILITLKGYYSKRNRQPFYLWLKDLQRDEPGTSLAALVARVVRVNTFNEPRWLYI